MLGQGGRSFSLLREYGAHAVSRGIGLEEEASFEVGLGEHWARAHSRFKFKKGSVLDGPPVPGDGFLGEVKEWAGDF
jgi:hypothetical protein